MTENKGDLISRESLKEALNTWDKFGYTAKSELIRLAPNNEKLYRPYVSFEDVINCIDNAPTVLFPLTVKITDKVTDEDIEVLKQLMKDYKPQLLNLEPERPKGEWYYSCDKGWECNQCHKTVKDMPIDDNKKATYDFCPNCGAYMRGNQNDTPTIDKSGQ